MSQHRSINPEPQAIRIGSLPLIALVDRWRSDLTSQWQKAHFDVWKIHPHCLLPSYFPLSTNTVLRVMDPALSVAMSKPILLKGKYRTQRRVPQSGISITLFRIP